MTAAFFVGTTMTIKHELNQITSDVMDNVYSDIRCFFPYRVDAKTIIVPDVSHGQWDLLEEIANVCGVDRELWHSDQGYFVLVYP